MNSKEKYLNLESNQRRKILFPNVTDEQWNEWH